MRQAIRVILPNFHFAAKIMTRWLTILLLLCLASPSFAQRKVKKKAAGPRAQRAVAEPENAADADDAEDEEEIPLVVPVFDPGSHTRLIRALGFSRDQSRLITVGEDASIQFWSTATGERLDILRLPSYGHEQGYNAKLWEAAAISADGNLVAVGGHPKRELSVDGGASRAKLLLVDVANRTVRPVNAMKGGVAALAFAPDQRLAAAMNVARNESGIMIFPAAFAGAEKGRRSKDAVVLPVKELRGQVEFLQFSPDGKSLCAAAPHELMIWDLSGPEPKQTARVETRGSTSTVAWTPDGKRILRCWVAFLSEPHGLEIRRADGEQVLEQPFRDELPFSRRSGIRSIVFADPQTALLTSDDGALPREDGSTVIRFDLKTNTGRRLRSINDVARFHVHGAVSPDRKLAAVTTSMGLDAVVYRVRDGQEVARCGAASPVPTLVGWSNSVESPAISWAEESKPGRFNTEATDLQFAFDLAEMQPVGDMNPADFGVAQLALGEWKLNRINANGLALLRGDQQAATVQGGNAVLAATLIPRGDEPPWFAWAAVRMQRGQAFIQLTKGNGDSGGGLGPTTLFTRDLVASPDGRLLLVSTGTHRLCVYAVEGSRYPLLSVARVNGEWVAWSGNGYYAASPGGEKMFGWSQSHGPSQFATFHPAEKFARHFRRPELLARAVQLGSMEAALQQGETRSPVIDEILPPQCELKLLKRTSGHIQVQASATSNAKDKPIVAMRLLLDGRPLGGGAGQRAVAAGETAAATWELDVPPGTHELKLLARNEDNSAVSNPLSVTIPKSAGQQPVLHRLCVGINEYQLPAYNLGAAAKDAKDVFAALEQYCVGPENRFGSVAGTLLTNKQATRAGVLKAIGEIRKAAKPGDLVVLLFAGHGIKQQEEFYLMTHEADPSTSLKGKSLSGDDLRQALSEMECPVLLIMDACHSARGVKAFRPATDDLTRSLTDDSAGVTVLAAAMAHEVASATQENGHFTAAFLKALQLGKGVPFDPHEHVLYTHHIYSVVFSEVRKATNGKQNPFLNMPWTVPPIAVRDVPAN